MKGNRLKTLGFALVGGLALLFAGCGQQAQTPPPPPGTPTTVAVEGLYSATTSTPVDPNNVSGLVIVRAKVALGSVVPDKVQFLLDNNVEYEVNFGAATQGIRPQQATYTFEWNLNTAALANLAPKYPNGAHTVQVRLVKGGNPVATSTATSVQFNNTDFTVLKISGNALNEGGNRYYGGGPVTLEVVPVLYSGKGVQSVELNLSGVGGGVDLDASTPGFQSTATLTSAPYVFTIPYNSTNKNSSLDGAALGAMQVTVTYTDTTSFFGPPSAVLDGSQVLVDGTGLFSNNPPFILNDLMLDFYVPSGTGALVCKGTTALGPGQFATSGNLLVGFSSYTPDAGVGGDQIVVDVKTTTNTPVLAGQAVSITGGGCPNAGALAGLSEGGFFQVYVKAVKDALGNTYTYSTPPASNPFGIDNTKPTLALNTGRDNRAYFNSASLNTGSLSGNDLNGNSVGATIVGWLTDNDPASGTPPVASGIAIAGYIWKVNGQTITTVTTNSIPGLNDIAATLGSAPQGYYTLTVQATDNAGNVSDPVTLNVLYDNTAPNVVFTQPTVTALTGGTSFTATAQATDNVDLRQGLIYWSTGTIRFTALTSTPKAFGAPGVTSADYTGTLTALKPSSLIGNFTLFAWVQDMARNAPATSTLAITVTPANTNTAGTLGSFNEVPDITQVSGGSTTLTFTHTGGTAQVKAVHVYLWSSNDGTYDYYNYVADATPIGGGQYAVVFSAPANLSTPQVLVVVEYDNGLALGYTYDYDAGSSNSVF